MKVLIYGNRKQPEEIYDASTPEKEMAAYLAIFKKLDKVWDVYCDLEDLPPEVFVCRFCDAGLHDDCTMASHGENDPCGCEMSEACRKRAGKAKLSLSRDKSQKALYDRAKKGDANAARQLILARKDYEYENVREAHVKSVK